MHQLDAFAAVPPETHSPRQSRLRRDLGITRAQLKAERESPKWTDIAAEYLRGYATRIASGQPFLIEDAIEASYGKVPSVANRRAWGAAVQAAARREWIVKVATAPARSSNGSPKCTWCAPPAVLA